MATSYLYTGPENEEKTRVIASLKKQVLSITPNTQQLKLYPHDVDAWLREVMTASLFSEGYWVELHEADNLSAAQNKAIKEVIEHGPEDLTLVIVSDQSRLSSFDKLIPDANKKVFWELFQDKKEAAIASFVRTANKSISRDAIALILELVPGTMSEMRAAVEQLCLATQSEKIGVEEVLSALEHTRIESVFSLFEFMTERDDAKALSSALGAYRALVLSGNGTPWELLPGLLWQFRRLASFGALLQEMPEMEAAARVQVLDKPAAIRGKKLLAIYRMGLARWRGQTLARVIVQILEVEAQLRSYPGALHQIIIERLIYKIIMHPDTPLAEYPDIFVASQY